MKITDNIIRSYALKNAVSHNGMAMQGPVISGLFSDGLKKGYVGKYAKKINEIILEVNKLSKDEQKKEFEKLKDSIHEREHREGLPELPNAKKGKVVMRFAPSASGALHVGHAISNMISSLYVRKYSGKFYVRIEDTNPDKVLPEAYKKIKEDCDWIFGNVYKYVIQSDRIEIYYKYADKLIKKKSAYVCTCSHEKFKELIDAKKECLCRKNSTKENMKRWKWMLSNRGYKEGEAVLRFKSDIKHKNPAMRDFPLARINLTNHPRQGNKYRVWPLMNLAVPVDDIELKMTHIIRGKDHRDNAERQKMIFKTLGKKYPWTAFMGIIKFSDLNLSKRNIASEIKKGKYSGWDDEKLPTISSLRKRGYNPEAFAKFAEQRGLTEVDKVINSDDFFEILDSFNYVK